MRFLFVIALLAFPLLSKAELQIQARQNTAEIRNYIKEVKSYLPDAFQNLESNNISIEFKAMDKFPNLINPCIAKTGLQIFGKFDAGKNLIILNKNFLEHLTEDINGQDQFSCGHKNFKRLAVATLLHELTHFYDNQKSISRSLTYMSLAGDGILSDTDYARSPDTYEYTNIAEHLAVNMEYFLLDPEYSCRRPNLNRFFNQVYKMKTPLCNNFPTITISNNKKGMMENQPIQANLSPSNVLEIRYVVAGNGEAAMSRFGHSMFKIVMRPPYQDLTVGFVGVISETTMSTYKGLTGKYPSKLSISSYAATVASYTQDELRLISEYPLKLSEEQKTIFLQQVMTIYYEYTGRYYFITNNCATEAMKLLRAVYSKNTEFQKENSLSPKGVLKDLIKYDFIDQKSIQVIPSYWNTLEKLFEKVQPYMQVDSLKKYWKLPAEERQNLIDSMALANKQAYLSLLSLETTILERDAALLEKKILKTLNDLPDNNTYKQESKKSAALTSKILFLRGPLIGYGIPTKKDYSEISKDQGASIESELHETLQVLQEWGEDFLKDSKEFKEIQMAQNNQILIKKLLKNLPNSAP